MDGLTGSAEIHKIEALLREANVTREELVVACKFDDVTYARNELAKSEKYQLLVICWKGGQSSPIHDHYGSLCGVRVIDGEATETIFEEAGPGMARPISSRIYQTDEVCVTSDRDIHLITNEQPDQDLVTLHLYTPPLKMRFFENESAFLS